MAADEDISPAVLCLLAILMRLAESLPPLRSPHGVCGICGCLLGYLDKHCPNCEFQLMYKEEVKDG